MLEEKYTYKKRKPLKETPKNFPLNNGNKFFFFFLFPFLGLPLFLSSQFSLFSLTLRAHKCVFIAH
ncbi:hypothetical protein ACMBCN_03360, partial [Candidatus Liberibacter asiaticus]|nr:hypothetical protein [Candidatus Liberibacter asiaticus]